MERSVGDTAAHPPGRRKRRRKMSTAAWMKISEAQKARWARQRSEAPAEHARRRDSKEVIADAVIAT
jgi:hypothetical protein